MKGALPWMHLFSCDAIAQRERHANTSYTRRARGPGRAPLGHRGLTTNWIYCKLLYAIFYCSFRTSKA